ncbi:glycosyltransferase family 4 protein [Exiguobacterium sp. 17-1]|uniref:glycosyltransferase family 4 protein n=1 Tax=Exiguobacterium sp. 17-1 TaxID=2931981 RepID=UPI001FFE389C|nr:glycosyltransferase family 4 protein [Exiguobacterium sp. 17-1]MCK2156171.1 glycosyltransferase family 4 protein [Exiguobacterium sp. 17-1]
MKILFLSLLNIEEINNPGIYTDLIREFRNYGHDMTVVGPYERRENKETIFFRNEGIDFLQIKIGDITKTNKFKKGISILQLEYLYLKAIKKYIKKNDFDLIIYTTPPITFERVIKYLKRKNLNAKTYLLLKDIFPQNAVDLGYFSKLNPIYHYFRFKEKRLYKQSDRIGCMTINNLNYILKNNNYLKPNRIEVCPNTITIRKRTFFKESKNMVREKYNLPLDKTIYIYGGNLGKPQGVDFLCKVLLRSMDHDNMYFLIVGSGTEYKKLQTFILNNKIKNTKLIPQMSRLDYEEVVYSSDVGMIFLDHKFTIPNFPSRILSYMQASLPILAATDCISDLSEIIEGNKLGQWCKSDDVETFYLKSQKFLDKDYSEKIGMNSNNFLENNYSSLNAVNIILGKQKEKEKVV